jgi:hypothetical protein
MDIPKYQFRRGILTDETGNIIQPRKGKEVFTLKCG